MSTIGLYFKMSKATTNEMRHRLNELFGRLGYATDIPSKADAPDRQMPWRGGLSHGLMALDRGELALVPVPDPGSIEKVITELRRVRDENQSFVSPHSDPLALALEAYAQALETALIQANRASDVNSDV